MPYEMGELLPKELLTFSPEVVIHLAWDGIPDFSEHKSVQNVSSQILFFRQLKSLKNLQKVIGAGTCREYGSKLGICSESDKVQSDSYFSWAKLALSEYLTIFCKQNNIVDVWLRLFYVYGPGQRAESLIPSIIRAYRLKTPPTINNPNAANDFIYIDDVVNVFINAIKVKDCQGVFNIGSGKLVEVSKIAKIIEYLIGGSTKVNESSLKLESCKTNTGAWADLTLVKNRLGFYPKTDLIEGIKETLRKSR
jgi:nucleoside-diphosphate-sugar epimerase